MKEKRYFINIVEYGVMNRDWDGWRMARIEVFDNQNDSGYASYEGFIRLPEKAFELLREELDFKHFDKLPYMRFEYDEKKEKK